MKKATVALMVSLFCLFLPSQSVAHKGAKGVVKERMMLMKGIGENMKLLKGMIKHTTPLDWNEFNSLTQKIKQDSQHILVLFPEGSIDPPAEA